MVTLKCALCTDKAIENGATEDSDEIPAAVSIFPVTMDNGQVTQAPLCFACRVRRSALARTTYEVVSRDSLTGAAVVRWMGKEWDVPSYLLDDRVALADYLRIRKSQEENGSGRHSQPVPDLRDTWTKIR